MDFNLKLSIPLVSEENEPAGCMHIFIQGSPKYLPRVGEQVYVYDSTFLEVVNVSYQGLSLHMVTIELKPLSSEYRGILETSTGNRKDSKWSWSK